MSGVITAVVATVTEVVTAVATAVTAAAEAVAGAVVSGAEALGVVGTVGECTAAEAALTGGVTAATEGAIYGAGFGALATPITGGDLGQNILFGALSGGVGGAVSPAISGAAGELGLSPAVAKATGMGVGNALGGTVASAAMGKDPLLPALGGLVSGVADFAVGGLPKNASWLDKALNTVEKNALTTGASMGLSDLLYSGSSKPSQQVGGGMQYQPIQQTNVTTTGQGSTPGSSALAQVLRTDAGAPIFGSSDKEGQTGKSGWNIESLRYMGSEA